MVNIDRTHINKSPETTRFRLVSSSAGIKCESKPHIGRMFPVPLAPGFQESQATSCLHPWRRLLFCKVGPQMKVSPWVQQSDRFWWT